MPTTPPSPPERPHGADFAWITTSAAAYAAAEILVGIAFGRFFESERAEAFLFFAFRPALTFLTVLAVARHGWVKRAMLYLLALIAAALAETLLLLRLGAPSPWEEMVRGLIGGMLLFALADPVVQASRRWAGRHGRWLAVVPLMLLLALPGALKPYEALILAKPASAAVAPRPKLMLMTGLPLVWGEAGPFDPSSRPALAYKALQEEFRIELLDTLEPRTLAAGHLLLLAQPQRLSPSELTALDAWVRQGGRALILADPLLVWPSELPLGDIRRAPPVSLLAPLLSHWGVELRDPVRSGRVAVRWKARRLVLEAPGSVKTSGGQCAALEPWRAICRLGAGRAMLIADADLMRDDLWALSGPERHRRTADNPLAVAGWLDELEGAPRPRAAGQVAWAKPGINPAATLAPAFFPLALLFGVGLLLGRHRRAYSQNYPQRPRGRTRDELRPEHTTKTSL